MTGQDKTLPYLMLSSAPHHAVSMRMEAGFRRDFDGSLWLQEPSGTWHETKLDAKLVSQIA